MSVEMFDGWNFEGILLTELFFLEAANENGATGNGVSILMV